MKAKSIILWSAFTVCMLFVNYSYCQTAKEIKIEIKEEDKKIEVKAKDTSYTVRFAIRNKMPSQVIDSLVFTPVNEDGDAFPILDYNLINGVFSKYKAPTGFFTINLKGDSALAGTKIALKIMITTNDTTFYQAETIKLVKQESLSKKTQESEGSSKKRFTIRPCKIDTGSHSISIVTAANFDFFGNSIFKNYAGELKVFLPNLWMKNRIGLIVGLENFQYYVADSSKGNIYNENVLLDRSSRQFVYDTTKFLRQVYALNSKTDVTLSGGFAQLIYRLNCDNDYAKLYGTLHADFLATTTRTKYEKAVLFSDTLTYKRGDERLVYSTYGGIRPEEVVRKRIDGYLGVGITAVVSKKNAFDFFGQAIIGKTTLNPTLNTIEVSPASNTRGKIVTQETSSEWGSFYLIKSSVTERITKLNGTAGIELRGLFPKYSPFIGAYLGFKIDLEKFFK